MDLKAHHVMFIDLKREGVPSVLSRLSLDGGAGDARLLLLGRQRGELEKILGEGPGIDGIQLDCSAPGKHCEVSFICYGFWNTECQEVSMFWSYH